MNPTLDEAGEHRSWSFTDERKRKQFNQTQAEEAMGRETRLFKTEERKNRVDISNFFHQLADKIASGKVVLSQGTENLTLQLPENLILEVQVEDEEKGTKGIQHSLEVEIKWFDNDQGGSLELK
jgi:amphi-Trp domain-containing protein